MPLTPCAFCFVVVCLVVVFLFLFGGVFFVCVVVCVSVCVVCGSGALVVVGVVSGLL
jgi:hypothetical protein